MATGELSIRRSDELSELRERYNQLCAALTLSAGASGTAAERVMQELQALAQMIAARQAERDASIAAKSAAPPVAPTDPRPEGTLHKRSGNVVAFRFKVKGGASENPRLPAALNRLSESDGQTTAAAESFRWQATPVNAAASPLASPPAAMNSSLHVAVSGQGAEIERLARSNENQRQLLERLQQRLSGLATTPELAGDVAELRSAAARHGQQIVTLAAAVHRLAKLLAADSKAGR